MSLWKAWRYPSTSPTSTASAAGMTRGLVFKEWGPGLRTGLEEHCARVVEDLAAGPLDLHDLGPWLARYGRDLGWTPALVRDLGADRALRLPLGQRLQPEQAPPAGTCAKLAEAGQAMWCTWVRAGSRVVGAIGARVSGREPAQRG